MVKKVAINKLLLKRIDATIFYVLRTRNAIQNFVTYLSLVSKSGYALLSAAQMRNAMLTHNARVDNVQ